MAQFDPSKKESMSVSNCVSDPLFMKTKASLGPIFNNKYWCGLCKKALQCVVTYNKHINRKHYECGICGEFMEFKVRFKKHKEMHKNNTMHRCIKCFKSFNRRDKLKGHFKRMHTENLAQRCDKCMKIVKDLKNHILLHNSNKTHKCNICHQSFFQRNVFRKHMIVHSRIHVCNQCEKSASDSSSLKIHMKSHSSERSIKCLIIMHWSILKKILLLVNCATGHFHDQV